eukprot:CAMPEP_0197270262 /NCGR_PEP_ID=MMETSP1432-20130617/6891_1 /TAXON_ID=44447 /ORGANISM="Pseudo-nitzschia delicatissima, Strain UNC1205" /LENGTH=31 /DNA_ID= /DNA_START= /DNA_END= /DNA_ORIENTATION=
MAGTNEKLLLDMMKTSDTRTDFQTSDRVSSM